MSEQKSFRNIISSLMRLDDSYSPNPLRKLFARYAYLKYAKRLRADRETARTAGRNLVMMGWRRRAAAGVVTLFLALSVMTGVVGAADRSRPGDPLYPVDLQVEQFQLLLAYDMDRRVFLLLSIADERLLEIQQLAEGGRGEDILNALDAYEKTIMAIEQLVKTESVKYDVLVTHIDDQFVSQEERLHTIRSQVPEQARPGLDHAIEVVHTGHENILLEESSEVPTNVPIPSPAVDSPSSGDVNPEGPPINLPVGPPDDVPNGPPNWAPAGPPITPPARPTHTTVP